MCARGRRTREREREREVVENDPEDRMLKERKGQ